MAFTNGTLYGQYDGEQMADNPFSPWNSSNTTNPNQQPKNDLFQILAPGGAVLLRVSSNGTVTTNVAVGVATISTMIAAVQMTAPQFAGLPLNPTASQICQAAFPLNFGAQQLDIFQVVNAVAESQFAGGGAVVYRLQFNGASATS